MSNLCKLFSYKYGSENIVREERVSGNIISIKDDFTEEGEFYIVRSPDNAKSWVLGVCYLQPTDLRALADRIEEKRKQGTLPVSND